TAPAPRWRAAAIGLAIVASIAVALLALTVRPAQTPGTPLVIRFQVLPPDGHSFSGATAQLTATDAGSVSPDGTRLIFSASTAGGASKLWLRPVDSFAARPLDGTDDALFPFWSPDSRSVGFFVLATNKLRRIDVSSGSVQTI